MRASPGRRTAIRVLAALFLFIVTGAATGGAAETNDGDPLLFLTERPYEDSLDQWNFSVFPPDPGDAGGERFPEQQPFPTFLAKWWWYLAASPESWSVKEGDTWETILFIGGLDEVLPLPALPPSSPTALSGYEIRVEISESETVFASGWTAVPLAEVEPGVHGHRVEIVFDGDQEFQEDGGKLRIEVAVSGRGQDADSPLSLHYGSTAHPSRLFAPGYPMEAFRELELAYLSEQECRELLLQQKSCKDLQDPKNNTQGDPGGGNESNRDNGQNEAAPSNGTTMQQSVDEDAETGTAPGPGAAIISIVAGTLGFLVSRPSIRNRAGYGYMRPDN